MNYPHGDAGFEYERIEREAKRFCWTGWLKPGRVELPCPGLRLTVTQTNGGDAKVSLTIDPDEWFRDD